jgi:RimJ/RimL family protein N-acetyltransferase
MQRIVVVQTRRLAVTSWLPSDIDALHDLHSDAETMRFVRHGHPESHEEVAELLHQYIAEQATREWTKWRVSDHDDHLVGRAGFGSASDGRMLAYLIRRTSWGQGLATEVASALVGWHLAHAAGVPLRAIVAVGNDASIKVLEKVGFDEVGLEDFEGTTCLSFVYKNRK